MGKSVEAQEEVLGARERMEEAVRVVDSARRRGGAARVVAASARAVRGVVGSILLAFESVRSFYRGGRSIPDRL